MDNCQVFSGKEDLFITPTEGALAVWGYWGASVLGYRECWRQWMGGEQKWRESSLFGLDVLQLSLCAWIEVTIKALNYTNQHQSHSWQASK